MLGLAVSRQAATVRMAGRRPRELVPVEEGPCLRTVSWPRLDTPVGSAVHGEGPSSWRLQCARLGRLASGCLGAL